MIDWSVERIMSLSIEEVQTLRQNALARAASELAALCDAVLLAKRPRAGRGRSIAALRSTFSIGEVAIDGTAKRIVALPKGQDVPFGRQRLERIASPVSTFSALWRQYLVCGFSSQEPSDPGTPLARFAASDTPLLQLDKVLENGGSHDWIDAELAGAGIRRFLNVRRKLIASARTAFLAARGTNDELANGRANGKGISIFLDLAIGRVSDRDLANSATFSAALDSESLYGIGHKQLRNILVNVGLARNVIPLDSRWRGFLSEHVQFEPADLAQKGRYLAVENVLRQALLKAQALRPDIENLAVLDALVFASMSKQGAGVSGWAGS